MIIGVTGATGQLGRLVIARLKQRRPEDFLVALARTVSKAAGAGVEVREADYDKPSTLETALRGLDVLLLISSSEIGRRAAQHRNVVHAAVNAGVRRLVYTSLLHADSSPLSLAEDHRATEDAIRSAQIPFTILRNGWYTENETSRVLRAAESGELSGCAGEGRISSAARADYAEAAVTVLTTEGHEGKTYELAGDDSWTLRDLAAEISRQLGRAVAYRNLTEMEYADLLTRSGLPAPVAALLAGFDTAAARGALFDDGHELSRLVGRPTTPLSVFVTEVLRNRQTAR